jgi:uncharacterized membrane protein HdeD (DUF308 family)
VNNRHFLMGLAELSHRWGWYLALGILLMILGALAAGSAISTTVLSVIALGWILVFAGAVLSILSFLIGRWSGFLLSLAAGVFSLITGATMLRAPLAGAASLTLVLSLFFLIGGIYRAITSTAMRFPYWGWSLFSGIVSIALGAFLIRGWPTISLWFLGLYIGIDLVIHGFAWCMFALRIRVIEPELRDLDRRAA